MFDSSAPADAAASGAVAPRRRRRRLVSLLNKLTPTTFEAHVARYVAFANGDGDGAAAARVDEMVRTIARRAAEDGPRYVAMHAALCARLASDLAAGSSFRSALVAACREGAGREVSGGDAVADDNVRLILAALRGEEGGGEDTADGEYERDIAKRLYVGHLQFCAELYKCGIFGADVAAELIGTMCDLSFPAADAPAEEVRLEGLVALLDAIGWKLELPLLAGDLERVACWARLEDCVRVGNAQDDQEVAMRRRRTSSRLRCLVLGLLELRAGGWRRAGALQRRRMLVARPLAAIRDEAPGGTTSGRRPTKEMVVRFAR